MVFEKGTSGYQGITSSIYLNGNISVFTVGLISNLFLSKQNDDDFYFIKRIFVCHFRSRTYDFIKISISDIFLILLWIEPQFVQSALGSQNVFDVI